MKKILLVTQDFPPLTGGIANYYYNRVKKIPPEKVVILMNKITHYSLPITHYSFKIIYKNFFTQLIWPHWLPLIWHTYKIAKREKVDMFWVGQALPIGSVVWLVSKLLKIPYYMTCHGNDLLRAKSVPRKFKLARKILHQAEYIEANTEFTKNILIKDFNIVQDKIKIVYPECTLSKKMVDKNKVEELRKKYNLQGKKVLLTVARLVKSKGVDNVIKALPKVWEQVPDLVYIIVGDGEEKDDLVELARRLAPRSYVELECYDAAAWLQVEPGANKHVIFTGNILFKELPNYYALADIFILTPRNFSPPLTKGRIKEGSVDTESFGIVYLEAQEFGLPIVAGDVGGVREINYNKITLVDSENINKIANEIAKLLNGLS